jgi:hypothetical protein
MGYVYLIQPAELRKTNRYKVGCSTLSNLSRITCGYRKGFIPVIIMFCEQPKVVEHKILQEFTKQFKLFAGREIFEGDIAEMRDLFYYIVHHSTSCKHNFKCQETNKTETANNSQELSEFHVVKIENNKKKYMCNLCGFSTHIKTHYNTHLKTKKHSNKENETKEAWKYTIEQNEVKEKTKYYFCNYCNKRFSTRSSKSRHQSKYCKISNHFNYEI